MPAFPVAGIQRARISTPVTEETMVKMLNRPSLSRKLKYPHIYALGDVAETGAVRMGRAAVIQASVVAKNITRAVKGKALKEYHSITLLEVGIGLTLGLVRNP
jgi:NADH dehydrogenase FAD-containing subunit